MRLSRTFFVLVFALFIAICAPAPELAARAGGGHSSGGRSGGGSSGGSRSSSSSSSRSSSSSSRSYGGSRSSGSSGSGKDMPTPVVVFIGILVVVVIIVSIRNAAKEPQSGYVAPRQPLPPPDHAAALRKVDPNFSLILFKAFAYLVYVKYQEWRGSGGKNKAITPYLMPQVLAQGASGPPVAGVLVEALEIKNVYLSHDYSIIDVHFAATLMLAEKGERRRVLRDDGLRFVRATRALTPAPEQVLRLGCPSCGSPEEPNTQGACPSCGAINLRGATAWCVADVQGRVLNFKPEELGQGGGVEVGTDYPTRLDPMLNAGLRELSMRDATFKLDDFMARARFIFHEIQAGWSEINEARLRPHETDTVFDAHRYWLMHYRDQGVRNVLADVRVENMTVAKVKRDAWFDAITVRVFASMIDYEIGLNQRLLCGDMRRPRRFSEYWTFVRRADRPPHAAGATPSCPSCGAPLDKINQAGVCGYCNAHVTLGEFDWVLALIEQDETYAG